MMNAVIWKRLIGPLTDETWRLRKTLAYIRPVGSILHGVLGEDSPSRDGFYLWVIRLPLFVPTDVLDLNWSDRFGGGTQIFSETGEATRSALSEAMRAAQLEARDMWLVPPPPGGADNVRMQEARGYALFLAGDTAGALEVLGRVIQYPARLPWEHEFVDRAGHIRALISDGQGDKVRSRLAMWREESLHALGIDAS
jgi:hypothetical protein